MTIFAACFSPVVQHNVSALACILVTSTKYPDQDCYCYLVSIASPPRPHSSLFRIDYL